MAYLTQHQQHCFPTMNFTSTTPIQIRLCLHAMQSDGHWGCPERGPYDAIHVGAAAGEVPGALLQQLKPGGRLVLPVRFWHAVSAVFPILCQLLWHLAACHAPYMGMHKIQCPQPLLHQPPRVRDK